MQIKEVRKKRRRKIQSIKWDKENRFNQITSILKCYFFSRKRNSDFCLKGKRKRVKKNGAKISISRQGLQIPIRVGDDGK